MNRKVFAFRPHARGAAAHEKLSPTGLSQKISHLAAEALSVAGIPEFYMIYYKKIIG